MYSMGSFSHCDDCAILEHLWVLLPDAVLVLLAEYMVDWGKHAFVLKFNEIHSDVRDFTISNKL